MADFIQIPKIETSMEVLKETISLNLADDRLTKTYAKIIDGFVLFCKNSSTPETPIVTEDIISQYYVSVTGTAPFTKPNTVYLRKLARPILMIRDVLAETDFARKYCYGTIVIPNEFEKDISIYENWLTAMSYSPNTIYTRIGRIKPFLQFLSKSNCKTLTAFTPDLLIQFIASITMYSSAGKSNILYTLKNYFSCPGIMEQLCFAPLLLLTNMHTNKHERLASCYTPEEIRRVLASVDRSSGQGKMLYLMMLFACVYGLRVSDIRTFKISNIDWRMKCMRISQHKTKRYLELPLTQDVCLALLDYIKNARPLTDDTHLFIKQRSPHTPYSEHDHFSGKMLSHFQKAGINTERKHAGLHSMRHSLASSMMYDGVPINEIAIVLGHTSAQATNTYIWSDFSQLKAAALEVIPYGKR